MVLNVTLTLPPDVEAKLRRESKDLNLDVQEAFALDLFRRGTLTHYELSRMLGFDRHQTDAWLKLRGVYEGSPSMEEIDADVRTLQRFLGTSE